MSGVSVDESICLGFDINILSFETFVVGISSEVSNAEWVTGYSYNLLNRPVSFEKTKSLPKDRFWTCTYDYELVFHF